jgi:hypothetical protein
MHNREVDYIIDNKLFLSARKADQRKGFQHLVVVVVVGT